MARRPAGGSHEAFDYRPGQSLGFLVRDTMRLFTRSLQARIAREQIGLGQWFFLRVLWEEEGLTQRELSQRTGLMEPTTVSAMRAMEKKGLIRRRRNVPDRRKINIYLTARGRRLREVLLPSAREVNELATRDFSAAEIDTLRKLLARLKRNLEGDEAL